MQSGYGGVSEIHQQFMVDGCPPSLFSISPPPPPQNPNAAAAEIQHQQKFYHLAHTHHQPQQHHHHHPLQMPPHAHYSHLIHPTPITQQLFHQPHHQFQLFHHPHHALGLDHDHPAPENSASPAPPGPSFLASAMSFKLGVNESSGEGLNEDDVGILRGDDGSESRLHSWHREEESAASIKEPFWRPLDIDYTNRNNKRPNSPENNNNNSDTNYSKKSKEAVLIEHNQANTAAAAAAASSNYKLYSELEAIYKPGGSGSAPNNNQTGSGSALTGDDIQLLDEPAPCPTAIEDDHADHSSDASDGGDVPLPPPSPSAKKLQKGSGSRRKQRAKRRQQEQMNMITSFFESLVKQVMDHQESLHCKFLEVMERRDQERTSREEAWRKQEAARSVGKAASRAQERALAASREAAIISFLEKITGETLDLPTGLQFPVDESLKDNECNALELYNADGGNNSITNSVHLNTSRWPKTEVQALIRVRSGLETRFQEPGLKGPLWEEVSSTMAAMGYHRSAKRCKEKWENINKYFRKTKDSGKKRPQHSKTCPYFQQLDQLYSKSSTPPTSSNAGINNEERKDNSELLDAIVVSNDHQSIKFSDIGSTRTGINNIDDQGNEAGSSAMAGKSGGNYQDEDNEDEMDGEEGEGDSQEQDHEHGTIKQHHLHQGEEDPQRDSTFFFQRLHS